MRRQPTTRQLRHLPRYPTPRLPHPRIAILVRLRLARRRQASALLPSPDGRIYRQDTPGFRFRSQVCLEEAQSMQRSLVVNYGERTIHTGRRSVLSRVFDLEGTNQMRLARSTQPATTTPRDRDNNGRPMPFPLLMTTTSQAVRREALALYTPPLDAPITTKVAKASKTAPPPPRSTPYYRYIFSTMTSMRKGDDNSCATLELHRHCITVPTDADHLSWLRIYHHRHRIPCRGLQHKPFQRKSHVPAKAYMRQYELLVQSTSCLGQGAMRLITDYGGSKSFRCR